MKVFDLLLSISEYSFHLRKYVKIHGMQSMCDLQYVGKNKQIKNYNHMVDVRKINTHTVDPNICIEIQTA